MRFELKVAVRYLRSSRLQTSLILSGVAIGIVAFTFMAALINGLRENLTDEVIGNIAHVVLRPEEHVPGLLDDPGRARALVAVQRGNERRPQITGWRQIVRTLEASPDVVTVVPQAVGNGFVQRGEKVQPVAITGMESGQFNSIIRLGDNLVAGTLDPGPGEIVVGTKLAEEFGIAVGQRLRVRSDRGREHTLLVRAIFDVQSASINERVVFVELGTAQNLLGLAGSITEIAINIRDLDAAREAAERLAAVTGLEGRNWIDDNQRLEEALTAQASTGRLIKLFATISIMNAVGAVLLIATVRRKAEIGIMRSFGVSRGAILRIFVLQGAIIGLVGSCLGAAGGWLLCKLLVEAVRRADGTPGLPVNPAQGEYVIAIVLSTFASAFSAILPARQASRVDPVEVIQQ